MTEAERQQVRVRAGDRCEYCHLPQSAAPAVRFHVEHVVARQHGGVDDLSNVALACNRCNFYKGPNLTAIDAETRQIVRLFDPRNDAWADHFEQQGYRLVGRTATGRATVTLLQMNAPDRVDLRTRRNVRLS